MVHALTEVWRALAPGAVLLDIRPYLPFGPLELVERESVRTLGRLEEVQFDSDGASADQAISDVLRRGLFTLDRADSFYYSGYWDSVGELREYLREWEDYARLPKPLAAEARRALKEAGRRAWLRLQTYVVVNRLRKKGAGPIDLPAPSAET